MPNSNNKNSFINQYRRNILCSGVAFLTVCFSAPASLASGGGGGGDGGEQGNQTSGSKKKPIVNISQNEFRSMSAGEIDKYARAGSGRKYNIKVNGFSPRMSETLLMLALWDRAATRRLIKDMAKLKSKKERKARLKKEHANAKKLEKLLKASMKKLKKDNASVGAQYEEEQRWRHAKFYKEKLWRWESNPMEGTLK